MVLFMLSSSLPSTFNEVSVRHSSTVSPDCGLLENLNFNGSRAFSDLEWQVSLGPRIPESNASTEFRNNVSEFLQSLGYVVELQQHQHLNYNFTNVIARYSSPHGQNNEKTVIFSAHYDSRNIADRDENESLRSQPIDGANDGASGTAVLIELARLIPSMNLSYAVEFLWTDAEDQDQNFTLGSKAWAENLTSEEIDNIEAFILLDMVGDKDLRLHKISPGNDSLYGQIEMIAQRLGYGPNATCQTDFPEGILDYQNITFVFDDHVHPHQLGIPSIDIMDPIYGNVSNGGFGSLWHTKNDTIDNVSPEALTAIGRMMEFGLQKNYFVNFHNDEWTNDTQQNHTVDDENNTIDAGSSAEDYILPSLLSIGILCLSVALFVYRLKKVHAR
ncbi:MAG: M28 family peptidase [Candidatus Poseidoniales archaeon]